MATTLNLGTNIWADESTVPTATGAFADQYITGGSEGLMNRLISDSSAISSVLHADLISKLTVNSLTISNIHGIKVSAGDNGCITNITYTGADHQHCIAIAVGADISITSHDMTGKTAIGVSDFSDAELVHYTNSGDADTLDNTLRSNEVTATETFTNTAFILDVCTPISYRSSGGTGWIVYVGLSDVTEAGLQTALADYVIS
jgi:hypothetical protein